MAGRITVKIFPLPYYNKYASSDYTLCGIDFDIDYNGNNYHFSSESSDNCIKELLSAIDGFLSGQLSPGSELCYYIPWIEGEHCVYPYSFKISSPDSWSFRYKRNECDDEFDFECDISKDDIISMQEQLTEQFSKIDWDSIGKTPIYAFDLPDKKFEWCYSAKNFCEILTTLCLGKSIETMYVSATNYASPLRVEENFVNYYLGPELIIQMDDILLDLLIFASGLFKWRVFDKSEYILTGPVLKFIEDGEKEFCDIENVYNMFKVDYTDAAIERVFINETKSWPWDAKGFDEAKLGDPVELPATILFHLSNNYILLLDGWDDDFAIELLPIDG